MTEGIISGSPHTVPTAGWASVVKNKAGSPDLHPQPHTYCLGYPALGA